MIIEKSRAMDLALLLMGGGLIRTVSQNRLQERMRANIRAAIASGNLKVAGCAGPINAQDVSVDFPDPDDLTKVSIGILAPTPLEFIRVDMTTEDAHWSAHEEDE